MCVCVCVCVSVSVCVAVPLVFVLPQSWSDCLLLCVTNKLVGSSFPHKQFSVVMIKHSCDLFVHIGPGNCKIRKQDGK